MIDVRLSCTGLTQGERPDNPSLRTKLTAPGGQMTGRVSSALNVTMELKPALLVSYVYLESFLKAKQGFIYRDWALDSGAFSAHNSGNEIDLQKYIDTCKRLQEEDKTLVEVYALDVIGDWKASIKNCEKMWKQGVEAIPCFHVGEPDHVLKGIAKDYPKIALGGCVGFRRRDEWAQECFNRVWPKRMHGFGFGSERSTMALPFDSVDATTWEVGPCKFGKWAMFGEMSVRGSKQDLRSQVIYYLQLEQRARQKWAALFKKHFPKVQPGTVRLAEIGSGRMHKNQELEHGTGSSDPQRRNGQRRSSRPAGK